MRNLKFEGVAKVGDRIRSYDFEPCPGRPDRYVEGVVTVITDQPGFKAYAVLVDLDVHSHNPSGKLTNMPTRIGQTVYAPMEIACCDYEGRISKVA